MVGPEEPRTMQCSIGETCSRPQGPALRHADLGLDDPLISY